MEIRERPGIGPFSFVLGLVDEMDELDNVDKTLPDRFSEFCKFLESRKHKVPPLLPPAAEEASHGRPGQAG